MATPDVLRSSLGQRATVSPTFTSDNSASTNCSTGHEQVPCASFSQYEQVSISTLAAPWCSSRSRPWLRRLQRRLLSCVLGRPSCCPLKDATLKEYPVLGWHRRTDRQRTPAR